MGEEVDVAVRKAFRTDFKMSTGRGSTTRSGTWTRSLIPDRLRSWISRTLVLPPLFLDQNRNLAWVKGAMLRGEVREAAKLEET